MIYMFQLSSTILCCTRYIEYVEFTIRCNKLCWLNRDIAILYRNIFAHNSPLNC